MEERNLRRWPRRPLIWSVSLALLLTSGVASCSALPHVTEEGRMASEVEALFSKTSVPFTTIGVSHRPYIQVSEASQRVFQSQEDVDAFLSELERTRSPFPELNYADRTGILVAFGPQSTGMIAGEIAAVEDLGENLLVHSIRWTIPPGQPSTADIGYPYHFVSIPKTLKPIAFAPRVDAYRQARPSSRPWPSPEVSLPPPSGGL